MKSFRTVVGLGILLLVAAQAGIAAAQWVTLGHRVVNDRLDHDAIAVGGGRGDFTAIKLKVAHSAVHFRSVKIHFANGGTDDVELRVVIPAGGESRVIDVSGDDRVIRSVEFWYEAESLRKGERATVRLLGRR